MFYGLQTHVTCRPVQGPMPQVHGAKASQLIGFSSKWYGKSINLWPQYVSAISHTNLYSSFFSRQKLHCFHSFSVFVENLIGFHFYGQFFVAQLLPHHHMFLQVSSDTCTCAYCLLWQVLVLDRIRAAQAHGRWGRVVPRLWNTLHQPEKQSVLLLG